ncbi:UNVERIFIED_CONTAM: hypothetical protein GTU68_048256 [Idotea baltica]|nr:hypothetical protein [Idotea baltica]
MKKSQFVVIFMVNITIYSISLRLMGTLARKIGICSMGMLLIEVHFQLNAS